MIEPTFQLPPEFKRLLNAFHSKGVEYLLVGGYAVIFHGYVRTTGDVDLLDRRDSSAPQRNQTARQPD